MQMEQNTGLESTLVLANEYANSTEKAFAEGLATSIAVVDSQAKVAQVKTLRLKLFYDYDVALARLLQTAGVPEEFVNYCSGENTIFE
jgi:outer membrane protein TolC